MTQSLKKEPLRNFQVVKEIIEKYGTEKSSLIPILQDVQAEFRYLPEEMLTFIASAMKIPAAEVYGVATFYAQFSTEPKGKHIVQICDGTACHVRGSGKIIKLFREKLNIPDGEITSEDLSATVECVSCLGACALAPVIVADDEIHGNVQPEDVDRIIKQMKEAE